MSFLQELSANPPRDFPDRLADPSPPVVPPLRLSLLAIILLACLIPRVWMACWWNVLWSDSVSYLRITRALENGNFDQAFEWLGLNTFPVILMWLRRTGVDWTINSTR